ncbi:MAG: hypothetical protein LBT79_02690 [Elusimicrobiota bacterium]|jgi:hypothetical protein|nr:hypothetical protein [Elusimicrobiota bacterium]
MFSAPKCNICDICEFPCSSPINFHNIFNLDDIINDKWNTIKQFTKQPSSCDALYINSSNNLVLIEIKNRPSNSNAINKPEEIYKIIKKIIDSLIFIKAYCNDKVIDKILISFSDEKNSSIDPTFKTQLHAKMQTLFYTPSFSNCYELSVSKIKNFYLAIKIDCPKSLEQSYSFNSLALITCSNIVDNID